MESIIIADPRLSDAATLYSDADCAPSMPLIYLKKMQPRDRTRFTDLSGDIIIDIDLTAAKAATGITQWNFIGLFYSNADEDCTWSLAAASSQSNLTTSPSWTAAEALFWPSPNLKPFWSRVHGRLFLPTARTEDWIRITLNNSINPEGFLDIGRLYVADAYQAEDCNANWGNLPDWLEEEKEVRSQGGQRYPRSTGSEGIYPFVIEPYGASAHAAIFNRLQRIRRLRGSTRDIFVDLQPDETLYAMDKMMMGTFASLQPLAYPNFDSYSIQMTVKELR